MGEAGLMKKALKWIDSGEKIAAILGTIFVIIGFIAVGIIYPFKVERCFEVAEAARAAIMEKVGSNKDCCVEIENKLDEKVTEAVVLDKIAPINVSIEDIKSDIEDIKKAQQTDAIEIKQMLRAIIKAQ